MISVLSLLESRVLGVLIEKQHTVPDAYPLTLNALVTGCNQKTSRHPVIEASETEVQSAADSLKSMLLVIETSGGRVARFSHNAERVLQVPAAACALLAVLMLRGPQTSGELRINCERLHRYSGVAEVEETLRSLAGRPAGALVVELSRQSGMRENRWAHLLSGAPAFQHEGAAMPADPEPASLAAGELAALKANVARLQTEVGALKALVARVCAELGICEPLEQMPVRAASAALDQGELQ